MVKYKNIWLALGRDRILAHPVTWKLKLLRNIQFCWHKPDWNVAQHLLKDIQWFHTHPKRNASTNCRLANL